MTKLLEDLVFFVVDIPNSGQDVLEIMVNKPNRERQKLMREQNILKQVNLFCIIFYFKVVFVFLDRKMWIFSVLIISFDWYPVQGSVCVVF